MHQKDTYKRLCLLTKIASDKLDDVPKPDKKIAALSLWMAYRIINKLVY